MVYKYDLLKYELNSCHNKPLSQRKSRNLWNKQSFISLLYLSHVDPWGIRGICPWWIKSGEAYALPLAMPLMKFKIVCFCPQWKLNKSLKRMFKPILQNHHLNLCSRAVYWKIWCEMFVLKLSGIQICLCLLYNQFLILYISLSLLST